MRNRDPLCGATGRSEINLRGLDGFCTRRLPGVAGVFEDKGTASSGIGTVLGLVEVVRVNEGGLEDSALLRGNGNSTAGGMGRMLARGPPPSEGSVEAEVCSTIFNSIPVGL